MQRSKVLGLVTLLLVLALFVTGIQAAGLPDLEPSAGGAQFTQEEPPPEEPPAEEPPPQEPPAEEPPAEEPPAEEPVEGDRTTIIVAPGEEETAPEESADPVYSGQGWLWLGIFAVVIFVIIGVVAVIATSGGGQEAPAQVASVPITSVAEDIKQGKISRIVVSGEWLRITRTDGVEMISRKEPTAEITQLLTNMGVPPEMMSRVVIEVQTP